MGAVDVVPHPAPDRRPVSDRRSAILDAFERCIVRSGFHRTTMQDVAKEASMSAGNLYRYFDSKDALVSGLCERDRERFGADFQHVATAPDVMGALVALGRKHFVEEDRSRCIQFMEIWAEATRNPAVAAVCGSMDREVNQLLVEIIDAAKAAGQVSPEIDSAALVFTVSALGDGLFMRRALDPTFDAEQGFKILLGVMNGILTHRIDLSGGSVPESGQAARPAAAAGS